MEANVLLGLNAIVVDSVSPRNAGVIQHAIDGLVVRVHGGLVVFKRLLIDKAGNLGVIQAGGVPPAIPNPGMLCDAQALKRSPGVPSKDDDREAKRGRVGDEVSDALGVERGSGREDLDGRVCAHVARGVGAGHRVERRAAVLPRLGGAEHVRVERLRRPPPRRARVAAPLHRVDQPRAAVPRRREEHEVRAPGARRARRGEARGARHKRQQQQHQRERGGRERRQQARAAGGRRLRRVDRWKAGHGVGTRAAAERSCVRGGEGSAGGAEWMGEGSVHQWRRDAMLTRRDWPQPRVPLRGDEDPVRHCNPHVSTRQCKEIGGHVSSGTRGDVQTF